MTTPGNIIEAVRAALGWTQTELSRRSGVHLNTLRDIESKGGWRSSKLPALADALSIDAVSLSKGKKTALAPSGRNDQTDTITILRYDTGGSMGNGTLLRDQPGIIRRLEVSSEWLEKNVRNYTSTSNLFVVTGFGDSMRPLYNSGDPLIVDAGVRIVQFDSVYFFRVADEGFIKRLQRVPGRGLVAISENSAYRDWVIDQSMDFELFGRVLKAWRSEDF